MLARAVETWAMSPVDFAFASMLAALWQCAQPRSRAQLCRDGWRVSLDMTTTRERPPLFQRGAPHPPEHPDAAHASRASPVSRAIVRWGSPHIYTAHAHARLPSALPVWATSSPRVSLAEAAARTPLQPLLRGDGLLPPLVCRLPSASSRPPLGAAWCCMRRCLSTRWAASVACARRALCRARVSCGAVLGTCARCVVPHPDGTASFCGLYVHWLNVRANYHMRSRQAAVKRPQATGSQLCPAARNVVEICCSTFQTRPDDQAKGRSSRRWPTLTLALCDTHWSV